MRRLPFVIALLLFPAWAAAADLTVFAASSLRESLIELGQRYEQQTGDTVRFNFAGSQALSTQIEFGAPADLFAAANRHSVDRLVDRKLANGPRTFAANRLVVLLARRAPPLRRLADLADQGVLIAIGSGAVPIGQYTRQLFSRLEGDRDYGPQLMDAIRANIRTQESSVRAIVTKLLLGEVDAGFVYQSDLIPAVRARTTFFALPEAHNPPVNFPAALLANGTNRKGAERFLDLMLSPTGQQIFSRHGFLPAGEGGT